MDQPPRSSAFRKLLDPEGWNWQGAVAIILALGASTTIILLAVQEIIHVGHVTAEEATLLSTVLGAVVGAAATYLGGRSEHHRE